MWRYLFLLLLLLSAPVWAYDPLQAQDSPAPTLDLDITDTAHQRTIPIRVYLPESKNAAPVILFSHGLGGNRQTYAYLGQHWAHRGYIAVFMQHHGSDSLVWEQVPPAQRMAALRQAANLDNLLARIHDVGAVLDQLQIWNDASQNPLRGRLDLSHVGMAGHSFGALTTQYVSGENVAQISTTDPRIGAAIALSPSTPKRTPAEQAFKSVKIPWLLMTGTNDVAPIGDADLTSRLGVFPALPAGHKYELVLDHAEHSAFSDRALPGDREPRNPNHHRAILALSTAFWDAWLKNDSAAQNWLTGQGPATVLQAKDHWQSK